MSKTYVVKSSLSNEDLLRMADILNEIEDLIGECAECGKFSVKGTRCSSCLAKEFDSLAVELKRIELEADAQLRRLAE